MRNYSEDALVEQPAIALFARLGYETFNAFYEQPGKHSMLGRETQHEVVLLPRLRIALRRLNPGVAREAIELAIEDLTRDRSVLNPTQANREIYHHLKHGIKIRIRGDEDEEIDETVQVIDWNHPERNDFLLVSQL